MESWKIERICKQCNKTFIPCKKTSEFCSKSCATQYRNIQNLNNGTHNFYKIDRSSIALERVKNGTHPFLKGNMDEEALKRKYKGIKNARIRESSNHTHPWQQPINFIPNEYSRSIDIAKKRKLTKVLLYLADTEFLETIKIGWTEDIVMREKDIRLLKLSNFRILKEGSPDEIILLEKNIKLEFFNEEYYKKYNSTEIFPIDILPNILNFINSSTTM